MGRGRGGGRLERLPRPLSSVGARFFADYVYSRNKVCSLWTYLILRLKAVFAEILVFDVCLGSECTSGISEGAL